MSSFKGFSFRGPRAPIFLLACMVALVLFFSGTLVFAETIYVVDTVSDDIGLEGSLRYAIDQAVSEDVISFDLAPYPKTIVLGSQLEISKSITIQGPGAENLAISGNETCRVFYIEATAEFVEISGVSIVNGYVITQPYPYGVGIYNESDGLTLSKCLIKGNSAYHGGGMYNCCSSPTLTSCTFSGNSSSVGGGMYNFNSNPTVTSCIFSGNSSLSFGGGMNNHNSSPTVTSCTFSGNSSNRGGGMYNRSNSSPTVTNCTFSGNSSDYGGAMCNNNSSFTVTSSTLFENSARFGGGMFNSDSSVTVTNCTFSGNSSSSLGSGMFNSDSNPIVTNCIFWNDAGREIDNWGETCYSILSYCVVQNGDCGSGSIISGDIISADPLLELLADNDGPTWTCALGEGSSAIDTGINTIVLDGTTIEAPDTDQRGVLRPQGSGYDIGAYEYESGRPHRERNRECNRDGDDSLQSSELELAGFDQESEGGGCSISSLPSIGVLLALPLFFLLRKMI